MRSLAKLTPAPFATIDAPAANTTVAAMLTLNGRVTHETIRAPLWLLSSEAGREWRPEGAIATGSGAWQKQIFLNSREGTHYRLALVAAEIPLHYRLKDQLYAREHPPWWPPPCWRNWQEEGGGARCPEMPLGDGKTYPPLPEGANLVTFADVTIGHRDDLIELPRIPMMKPLRPPPHAAR